MGGQVDIKGQLKKRGVARIVQNGSQNPVYIEDMDGNVITNAVNNQFRKSIMWLGDSKTDQSVPMSSPLVTDKSIPRYRVPVGSLFTANLNYLGVFVSSMTMDPGCTAGSGAVLSYTRSSRTMTWQDSGDTVGAPVDVSGGGWVRLESGSANRGILLSLIPTNEPLLDKSGSFTYAGYASYVGYQNNVSVPGMWNALNGNPFGENQFWYAIGGVTSGVIVGLSSVWAAKYTDITHIDLTTNGILSRANADQTYADIINIINLRLGVGSKCILALPNLDNLDYTTSPNIPKWKAYLAAKLQDYCIENDVESYSPAEYLNTGNSASSPNVAVNFNTDTVHYSQRGAYLIAKYLLDPILSKYAPKRQQLANPLIPYDATDAPNGNLLVNGTFNGTGGSAGLGVSGPVPDNWTAARVVGTVCTAVFSSVSRSDRKAGNLVRAAVNNTGGAANELIRMNAISALSAGNFSVGDKVVLSMGMFAAGAGISGVNVYLRGSAGGSVYALSFSNSADLGDAAGDTVHYQLSSMPFTLQPGFSGLVPRIEFQMAANGVANFDLEPNFCLRKVV